MIIAKARARKKRRAIINDDDDGDSDVIFNYCSGDEIVRHRQSLQ